MPPNPPRTLATKPSVVTSQADEHRPLVRVGADQHRRVVEVPASVELVLVAGQDVAVEHRRPPGPPFKRSSAGGAGGGDVLGHAREARNLAPSASATCSGGTLWPPSGRVCRGEGAAALRDARWNSPLALGEAASMLTEIPPADSPKIVTAADRRRRRRCCPSPTSARRSGPAGRSCRRRRPHRRAPDGRGSRKGRRGRRRRPGRRPSGEVRPVVERREVEPWTKAAAVDPDHHRQPLAVLALAGRPDVEVQAVLANRRGAEGARREACMQIGPKASALAHAGPARRRLRRAPAQVADRRLGERDALEGTNPVRAGRPLDEAAGQS